MAPSTSELEAALIDGTCDIYSQEPDATSVNKVRRHAEQKLNLDEGFFAGDEWKNKSKTLIKEYVDKLLDGWTPESSNKGKVPKNGTKRQSDGAEADQPKRWRRASQPEEKPQASKAGARRKSKPKASDKEGKPQVKRKPASDIKDEAEDETADAAKQDALDSHDASTTPSKTKAEPSLGEKSPVDPVESPKVEESITAIANEEEEYFDVLDELPQPKRKKKDKKEPSAKPSRPAPKKASASSPADPDEAEIKKLQSQLVKCGIRKLWHNELKRYDDDARAKIRHLKKMLADIGMDGRFSEAKAREIKEMRELMADAEAAQEMNALWGMRSGGRASRSKNKPSQAEESEASGAEDKGPEKGDDDDDEAEGNTFAARRRRAQADLAFLGDDSDSD